MRLPGMRLSALFAIALIGPALSAACGSSNNNNNLKELKTDGQPPCVGYPGARFDACIVIDADPAAPGLQQALRVPASGGAFSVDVLIDGADEKVEIGAFDLQLRYDGSWLRAEAPQPGPEVAQNVAADTWTCAPLATPPGSRAPVAQSSINCLSRFMGPRRGPTLSGSRKLATVKFNVVGSGTSRLTLAAKAGISTAAGSADITPAASCNPSGREAGGGCLNATVSNANEPHLSQDLSLTAARCRRTVSGPRCDGTAKNASVRTLADLVVVIFFYKADGSPAGSDGIDLQPPTLNRGQAGSFDFTAVLQTDDVASWRIAFEHKHQVDEILWHDDRL